MANDMILTDEQKAMQQLAYYDARGVDENQLRRIFRCTSADLEEVRKDQFYLDVLSAETVANADRAADIDDRWDTLEQQALVNLTEMMPSMMDPRTLLSAAVRANQAGRRRAGQKAPGSGSATINVDALTSDTKVVRIRSRFLQRLTSEGGMEQIVEREATIQADGGGDMTEAMTPREVKALLENSLGVDTDNLRAKRHQGPDEIPGIEIDFGSISLER